ncbi:MAG: LCP family protein [Armatimonadota bacterium]|nr:LCP family protein [Armatimonadota bacterium]
MRTPGSQPAHPAPEIPAVPPAPGPKSGRRGWWVYARYALLGAPVVIAGLLAGAALYLFTHHEAFTGSKVVDRPAPAARPFGWGLRLNRRVNVLIIGVDVTLNTRRQIVNVARSDSLMLVSFDPRRGQISGLSIPRDTRTAIPGVGVTKINAAYAFGGPALTIRTVEQLLGVPVHYYVKLGPQSFARLIDAAGGIEIDVDRDMKYTDHWAGLTINLKKGRQLLNGEQAMGYIRFRHDAMGDITRVGRQQKMLLALFRKLKSPGTILAAPHLLQAFQENTQTNLTMAELMTLGMFAARLDASALTVQTLPGVIRDSYWELDQTLVRRTVLEMFYGVSPAELAATGVEVLNGSGVPGLARQTAQRLERLGVRIVRVDAAQVPVSTTTITYRSDRTLVARMIAEVLGGRAITREIFSRQPGPGADISVVVGRDVAALMGPLVTARR